MRNKAYWKKLEDTFRRASEMLQAAAESQGGDPESVKKAQEQSPPGRWAEAGGHRLAETARQYVLLVEHWFRGGEGLWREQRAQLIRRLHLGVPGDDPAREVDELVEAIKVVRWYQHLILMKLVRALGQPGPAVPFDPEQADAKGSAKVALLGIERSIAAWSQVRAHASDEEREDYLLSLLVHLDRLRRETENVFPGARDFRRPGFDD
jgi:hypothetical protein